MARRDAECRCRLWCSFDPGIVGGLYETVRGESYGGVGKAGRNTGLKALDLVPAKTAVYTGIPEQACRSFIGNERCSF